MSETLDDLGHYMQACSELRDRSNDLLEALSDVVELLETEADLHFERRQAIKVARAAISKAESGAAQTLSQENKA